MNDFRLIEFDYDSSDKANKDIIIKYVSEYLSDTDINKDEAIDSLLYEISMYKIKVYIAYDGGFPFGIVACSVKTLCYHKILHFIFLEKEYRKDDTYSTLCESVIEITGYQGLVIITQEHISDKYINAGFFKVGYKNLENALVYFRSKNKVLIENKDEYANKHIGYMKKYVALYTSHIYVTAIFILILIPTLVSLIHSATTIYERIAFLSVSVILLISSILIKQKLNKHNSKGLTTFGFKYDMVYINQFQYKFRNKTKEKILDIINAFTDYGI